MVGTLQSASKSIVCSPRECCVDKKVKTRQIRVDEEVADMADRLAKLQSPPMSTPDFLSTYLRPLLRRDLARALKKMISELKEEE